MSSLLVFKRERTRSQMEKNSLDLLVASLPENIYYLCGFDNVGQQILSKTQSYLVYNLAEDKKTIVTSASDVPTLLEAGQVDEILAVGGFQFSYCDQGIGPLGEKLQKAIQYRYPSAIEALKSAILAACPTGGRIGLDESRTPITAWKWLEQELPHHELIPAAGIFSQIRIIKHPDEIALIQRSANIAEDAMYEAIDQIKLGMSEYEIARLFAEGCGKRGALPFFCVITIDERAAYSDTINTRTQVVKDGSVIRFDLGCIYESYRSDIARTVVVGNNQKAEDYYAAILEGEEKAIDAIRPGVTAEEIFQIALRTTQEKMRHYQRHHCGHGIGIEVYDPPSVAPGDKTVLQEGMTLNVETPYYEIGWGGVQVEDTVAVEKDSARYLTKSSRKLIKLSL